MQTRDTRARTAAAVGAVDVRASSDSCRHAVRAMGLPRLTFSRSPAAERRPWTGPTDRPSGKLGECVPKRVNHVAHLAMLQLAGLSVGFRSFLSCLRRPLKPKDGSSLAAPERRTGHLSPSLPRGTGTIWGRPQHICAPPSHVSAVTPHSRLLVDSRIYRFAHCKET